MLPDLVTDFDGVSLDTLLEGVRPDILGELCVLDRLSAGDGDGYHNYDAPAPCLADLGVATLAVKVAPPLRQFEQAHPDVRECLAGNI